MFYTRAMRPWLGHVTREKWDQWLAELPIKAEDTGFQPHKSTRQSRIPWPQGELPAHFRSDLLERKYRVTPHGSEKAAAKTIEH